MSISRRGFLGSLGASALAAGSLDAGPHTQHTYVEIPRGRTTICTGLSGSGKSSFAMDTLYTEGQRRYVESLSSYARQFLGRLQKPRVDRIEGLPPAIAIDSSRVSALSARELMRMGTLAPTTTPAMRAPPK